MSSGTRLMTIILASMDEMLASKDDEFSAVSREFVAILRREDAKGVDEGAWASNAMRAVMASMIGSVAAAGEVELARRIYEQHRERMEAVLAIGIADGLMLGEVAELDARAPDDAPTRGKETLQ